jgi:3',5'-cyclic AMP phosphodiesterase CpdA
MSPSSRRRFLHTAGLAGVSALLGLPARAGWTAGGARAGTLRLVFFTDVHAHTDWQAPRALAAAAKAINAEHPDLVIGGGDFIYDGFEVAAAAAEPQWDVYMAMHEAIRAPVEPILGNHDLSAVRPDDGSKPSADPRRVFTTKLGVDRTWRCVDAGGARIFLLDSIEVSDDELQYHGGISSEQLAWLRTELGRTDPDTPIVAATHIPFLSAIPQATKGAITPLEANHLVVNNREVLDLFAEHNLLLVLQGHLHAEEMLRWQGTTFITGGAVCGDKWRGPKYGTPEGFGVVTLRPDRVDWEYKSYR